jgi:hypothetical protein
VTASIIQIDEGGRRIIAQEDQLGREGSGGTLAQGLIVKFYVREHPSAYEFRIAITAAEPEVRKYRRRWPSKWHGRHFDDPVLADAGVPD